MRMGRVAIVYRLNPTTDESVEVDPEAIREMALGLKSDEFDVQGAEVKPLAFGLKFVQVHVTMDDSEGLSDRFEEQLSTITGVGEVEVVSLGLL